MTAAVHTSLEVIGQEEGDARNQPTREFHRTYDEGRGREERFLVILNISFIVLIRGTHWIIPVLYALPYT